MIRGVFIPVVSLVLGLMLTPVLILAFLGLPDDLGMEG